MKRIVQVVHDFLPEHPYGAENYTYHISKELQKTNKVYIFCREGKDLFGKDLSKDEFFDGLPVRRLYYNPPHTFEGTYRNSLVDKEFERFLDDAKPNVVHFQHLVRLSASMVEIAKSRHLPTVLTLHDFWFICPEIKLLTNKNQICSGPESSFKCANCENIFQIYGKLQPSEISDDWKVKFLKSPPQPLKIAKKLVPSTIKNALKERLLKANPDTPSITASMITKRSRFLKDMIDRVDIILAPSRFLRKKFIHYGVAEGKIIHSDYGVNGGGLGKLEKQHSNKFRFGFVHGISEDKGIRVLIDAFNKIKKDNVVLSIFGPYEKRGLSKLRKELTIDSRIIFYGPFDNRKISSILSQIDVLIYPSIWYENQPIAILEALLAKVPVITSNLGGMAELVQDGVTGLLFEAGNPDDLHQKMLTLIDNPELLRRLSESSRQVKTIEKNAEELNEIYECLLKQAGRPFRTLLVSG